MTVHQVVFLTIALSLPVITLVTVLRISFCVVNSFRTNHVKFALLSLLGIAVLFGIFSLAAVTWFIYAVGHSHKDLQTDLVLLAATGIPLYAASFALWRLVLYFEKQIQDNGRPR